MQKYGYSLTFFFQYKERTYASALIRENTVSENAFSRSIYAVKNIEVNSKYKT